MSSSRSADDRAPVGVAILGSTGSIGRQALDVLGGLGDRFRVVAIAAGRNGRLVEEQAHRFRPAVVAVSDVSVARSLAVPGGTRVESGPDALVAFAARDDIDLVVVATSGVVSLLPVLAALAAGKVVATAN